MNAKFEKLLSISEAAKKYNKTEANFRMLINKGFFIINEDCIKKGNTWIFDEEALESKYGQKITLEEYNNYINLIKRLVNLQLHFKDRAEEEKTKMFKTHRDLDMILTDNKMYCTYMQGINTLINNVKKYLKDDEELLNECLQLSKDISVSGLNNLRFGLEYAKPFTDLENRLHSEQEKEFFRILTQNN
ncbi:hypothetical protein [Clostridioides sp. ZZV15-6597]|uniref:hypothetical protein n=1 Tax=Clostridioides sp. ZZV15-6597 TaxID=2811500 RepID=UPI001D128C6D|nr:hypothetical protein [Clostridioides sp. ZZV15-6597]